MELDTVLRRLVMFSGSDIFFFSLLTLGGMAWLRYDLNDDVKMYMSKRCFHDMGFIGV